MREVIISKKYKLREDGKVINIKTGEEYKPPKYRSGYRITFNFKSYFVHRLVMQYFGEPAPGPEYNIMHINKDCYDNRIENLKWATMQEINSSRIDNLPVGERRCDFESLEEYRRSKCRRHYLNHRKEYYQKNRTKRLLSAKKYRESHHEQVLERTNQWRENNKDYISQKNKEYWANLTDAEKNERNKQRRERYAENEEIRQKKIQENIEYAKNNRDKVDTYQKIYRCANREKINEQARLNKLKRKEKARGTSSEPL